MNYLNKKKHTSNPDESSSSLGARRPNFKQRYFTRWGKLVPLQKQLIQSGEATLWQGPTRDTLAKIYHVPSPQKAEKLSAMIASPPQDPTHGQHHISIAWPQELIYNADKQAVGFLMPKISKARTLNYVYNPKLRRQYAQGFNWYYLHTASMNLAWILQALHAHNYVIGDLKTDNFLVTPQAMVSVIDTDSFQIAGHFCPVGSEGFTPAELIDQDLQSLERTPQQDAFGLAVIIYLMLFGYHPFSGTWQGEGPMPSRDFLIKEGQWMFAPNTHLMPSIHALPLSILHPKVESLFHQTFTDGHHDPAKRPTPKQWIAGLQTALASLEMCPKEAGHFYYRRRNGSCPWCQLNAKLGIDLFPTPKNFHQDPFLVQKKFEKAAHDGNDKELLKLWQDPGAKSLIQNDTTKQEMVDQAGRHKQFLTHFQKAFAAAPHDDSHLLSLWDKCKTFARSLFAHEKLDALGGKTPQNIIHEALKRVAARNDLEKALEKKPVDFQTVHEVWKTIDQKSHPTFKKLLPKIQAALDLARNYQSLLKALKKDEVDKVLALWDEAHFAAPIRQAGFERKAQEILALGSEKNHKFESLENGLFRTPSYLFAKWRWERLDQGTQEPMGPPFASEPQGAFMAVSWEALPKTLEDVANSGLLQLITKQAYTANKGAWFYIPPQFADRQLDVTVWPAKRNCGRYSPSGAPLHLTPYKPRRLYCKPKYAQSRWQEKILKLFGMHKISLKLWSNTMVRLPETNIVAAFRRPPVDYDPDTLYIAKLPAFTLHANDTKDISLPLPGWFTGEFEIALLACHKKHPLNVEVYYEVV